MKTVAGKYYVVPHGKIDSYVAIVHLATCPLMPQIRNAHEWNRNPLDDESSPAANYRACQRCKPAPSAATVARFEAENLEREAAESQRQREHEERRDRLASLWRRLNAFGGIDIEVQDNSDVIVFNDRGHRYEIREVEK